MLLITGPTGNVGTELVDLLNAVPDLAWRIGSRHPDTLRARGTSAEVVSLDFFERSSWGPALAGVTTLFLLFPLPGNKAARDAIVPFAHAAQRAGCSRVVYVSVFGADRVRFIPHSTVEATLRDSGMATTILRCSFFMQNLHRSVSTHGVDIADRGELFIPAGRGRTTFIDARDAAEVAASVLQQPEGHQNAVYHLTGSEALSMVEVAAALTDALGRPVRYTDPSLLNFARRLRKRGVGWDSIGFMSGVYTLTRMGRNQPITDDVHRLLGRPPRRLEEFLRDSAWRWRDRAWT
ncbi:SDR family NAD(P)-dependent oxidoreductase [Mycobacterium sp. PS03-16]|uniref:NmrA family NAD(P)-binding protein n=1 Tax=Mycobacterium sp. PS03-16 TaxID=2559611 RepID=UPI0010738C1F|nr:NmrA family NAD(P)-binding protein [Mycobacterium sp. PS03-16]TFV60246.1 SDR family NAD(P)-dependent oxidoreductase [Mycobacterium sp. PS03-16]